MGWSCFNQHAPASAGPRVLPRRRLDQLHVQRLDNTGHRATNGQILPVATSLDRSFILKRNMPSPIDSR
jgi:hypothetical protein